MGRAIAVELGKVVGAGSTLLLLARNKEDLEVTKEIVRDVRPGLAVEVSSEIQLRKKPVLVHPNSIFLTIVKQIF